MTKKGKIKLVFHLKVSSIFRRKIYLKKPSKTEKSIKLLLKFQMHLPYMMIFTSIQLIGLPIISQLLDLVIVYIFGTRVLQRLSGQLNSVKMIWSQVVLQAHHQMFLQQALIQEKLNFGTATKIVKYLLFEAIQVESEQYHGVQITYQRAALGIKIF